jgi:hypothetical protein
MHLYLTLCVVPNLLKVLSWASTWALCNISVSKGCFCNWELHGYGPKWRFTFVWIVFRTPSPWQEEHRAVSLASARLRRAWSEVSLCLSHALGNSDVCFIYWTNIFPVNPSIIWSFIFWIIASADTGEWHLPICSICELHRGFPINSITTFDAFSFC